jgi:membrane associated rhomboid family serine protease
MTWQETDDGPGAIQFTLGMMVLFVAVFMAELAGKNLAPLQAFPWRLGDGEIWRLGTSTVLHASLMHVGFNAIMFFRFSQAIERWLGPWVAVGLYLFFAVGAGAPQAIFGGNSIGAIGASGVVYGQFGFLWVCRRRYDIAAAAVPPQYVSTMLGWLVVCAVVNQFGGNIANLAHLGGLFFGWLVGQIVIASPKTRWPLTAATGLVWVMLAGLTWLPVWGNTLGRVPWVGDRYGFADLPQYEWQKAELEYGVINGGRVF